MHENLTQIHDTELLTTLYELNLKETAATARVLLYLHEVERRRLFRKEGFSSMFNFCCKELRYSESAAHRRLSSARLIGRFPQLLDLFLRKEVTVTSLSLVSGIITPENFCEVIGRIACKPMRETERLLAGYNPRARSKERIRPIAIRANEQEPVKECVELTFTLSQEAFEQFEELKALLSGKYPAGVRAEDVVTEALSIAVDKLSPRKREERRTVRGVKKKSERDQLPAQEVRSRYIPAPLRDQVYLRDGGCCTYVSSNGTRCNSRYRLQYHHKIPFARGGLPQR